MAEVRDKRVGLSLLSSDREAESLPIHSESAGEQLIKQLVQKQTSSQTTLEEQLMIRQQFVSASNKDVLDGFLFDTELTIEELQKKSGLSRQHLESALSEKPDSTVSKLYKFALSNQAGVSQSGLISLLPDHPLNHLKQLEKDLMTKNSKPGSKKRKRKHRKRKKKVVAEQTCEPGPPKPTQDVKDRSSSESSEHDELQTNVNLDKPNIESVEVSPYRNQRDGTGEGKNVLQKSFGSDKASSKDVSSDESPARRKRPSLWDVKNVDTMEKHFVGCREPRLFTIKEGRIVEVKKIMGD